MNSAHVFAAAIVASLLLGAPAEGSVDRRCLQSAGSHQLADKFSPLDQDHNLYAVKGEDDYVLHVVCAGDQVAKIEVVPKFFFRDDHPDWVEPDAPLVMSVPKYQEILDQIGEVKEFGKLRQAARIGIMDNLRMCYNDEYDAGMLERAMFRYSPEEDYKVAWFTVKYFRPISGKLQHKWVDKLDQKYLVTIDGEVYWTRQSTFEKLKVGRQVSVEAARTSDP